VTTRPRPRRSPRRPAWTIFLAQATPEDRLRQIRDEQAKGKLVAMCGNGTNDAPAVAQADVGVAMNTGPHAGGAQAAAHGARSADDGLDCNDGAKYFAIIPAIFLAFYPQL
jgi:K+-transporting ATPase ATPase B chain